MRLLLIALMLAVPFGAMAQQVPTITVQGHGEIATVPDMATVSLGVVREGDSAGEAMASLAEATEAVLERMREESVAETDVQTGQLDLQPRWERAAEGSVPRIQGYVARTTLSVRVRDLEALGALLDAVVSDGANELNGLGFDLQDPNDAEHAARRAAFEEAMARARTYADTAGLTVGPIIAISEGGGGGFDPRPAFAMEQARAMPIAPGEVMQSVTVTLVVELAPAQ
jgi:uncharacterized protein YggE